MRLTSLFYHDESRLPRISANQPLSTFSLLALSLRLSAFFRAFQLRSCISSPLISSPIILPVLFSDACLPSAHVIPFALSSASALRSSPFSATFSRHRVRFSFPVPGLQTFIASPIPRFPPPCSRFWLSSSSPACRNDEWLAEGWAFRFVLDCYRQSYKVCMREPGVMTRVSHDDG